MRKHVLLVILGTLLILSSSTVASDNTDAIVDAVTELPQKINEISYVSHGYINIGDDTEFDDTAIAEGWAGGGNATHPYIIEGYEIAHDGTNIHIGITSRHFIIRNCYLHADTNPGINFGLYLLLTPNAVVDNVTVSQKGYGFYLYDADNLVVTESKADNCEDGFYIRYSEGAQLTDLEAQMCTTGISIRDSDDVTFEVGSIHDNDVGLFIENSDNVQMSTLVVNDNAYEGILMDTSNYCQLEDTTIYNCGDNQHAGFNCTNSNYFTAINIETWSITQGFWIEDSFQPTIEDSYFHNGFQTGIEIRGCSDVTIRRTQVESNLYYGIGLSNTPTSLIEYCNVSYNAWNGISLYLSSDCTIMHSEIGNNGISVGYSEVHALDSDNLLLFNNSISYNNNENGVYLETSDFANLTRNTIYNNQLYGVWIWDSDSTFLENNTIYQNGDGIGLYDSHSTYMNNQNVHHNDRYGISTEISNFTSINDCVIIFNIDNGVDIFDSNDTIVSNCQIYNNSFFGIRLRLAERIGISYSDIYWNEYDGLYAQSTEYANVSFNDFWQNGGGDCEITLDHASHATIYGNTLVGNFVTQGMYVTWSHYLNIEYNTIVGNNDDGLNIQNSNYTYIAYNNISYNANTGIYLWESDFAILTGNTIVGNDAQGVYITACLNCTLDNNEISQNRLDGIYSKDSDNLVIEFNDIFDNGWIDPGNPRSGVYISTSDNCYLYQNTIYNNTVHGVYLGDSDGCILDTNTIYGNLGMTGPGCGIHLDTAHNTSIVNNIIHHNVDDGIYATHSDDCEVLDNTIYSNERIGIYVRWSATWYIHGNEIWDSQTSIGLEIDYCTNAVIDSNDIYDNYMGGIRFYVSVNCNFTNNMVHHNRVVGVQVDTSNGTLIQDNIIYDNYQWGLYLINANATRTVGNDFVLNALRDAVEFNSVGPNYWDDGVNLGNYWWGISRTLDNYTIYDDLMVEMGQDNYPMSSMWIDNAIAAGYEITSSSNEVKWTAFAHNPDYYEVYDGAILLGSAMWTGADITFNIDSLSAGIHNLEIVVYHVSGHGLNATVQVTVTDTTAPTWVSTPVDQEIEFGQALSYQLSATDASGIDSWLVSDTVNFTIVDGLLTNNTVLEVGSYDVTITVEDPYGNILAISITITVTEPTPPPIDGGMMILFLAGGGGVAVVVILIVILKRKPGE